jgi:hypothetical protein
MAFLVPWIMDQALEFEQKAGPYRAVLAYKCSMETLQARLLERGKTSGRADEPLFSNQTCGHSKAFDENCDRDEK